MQDTPKSVMISYIAPLFFLHPHARDEMTILDLCACVSHNHVIYTRVFSCLHIYPFVKRALSRTRTPVCRNFGAAGTRALAADRCRELPRVNDRAAACAAINRARGAMEMGKWRDAMR